MICRWKREDDCADAMLELIHPRPFKRENTSRCSVKGQVRLHIVIGTAGL